MLTPYSTFPRVTSTAPTLREGWGSLVELLTAPAVVLRASTTDGKEAIKRAKEAAPCWSPCVFRGTRAKAAAVAVSCAVLDLDGVDLATFRAVLCDVADLDAVVHSTARHAPHVDGLIRARVVIRLSRLVAAAEWPAVWRGLRARWPATDKADSDASRLYFLPSRLADCAAFARVYEGEALDVEELVASAPAKPTTAELPPPPKGRAMSREDLETLAKKLRRSSDLERAQTGRALSAIARGEPWAEPGEQDTRIFACFRAIVQACPWASDRSILALVEPSRALMSQFAGDWGDLPDKLARIRAHAERPDTGPTGVEPYSAEELAELGEFCGGSTDRRWILQRNGAWYLLVTDAERGPRYLGPFPQADRMLAAGEHLARAASGGVALRAPDSKGIMRAKSAERLGEEYGRVVSDVRVSLIEPANRYDEATGAVIEAPAPLRRLEPQYDPEVDEWLRLLCGEQYEGVQRWLAAATDLAKPCVALMFTGARGNGKSLFAESVARLWTTAAAVKWAAVKGGAFNDALTQCPLIFADEYVPLEKGTEHLREFITDRIRPLQRKFLPSATIDGCIRMVIASNDADALRVGGDLSGDTLGALAERILVVHTPGSEARAFTDAMADKGDSIRSGDRLARHALWLRDNLQWEREGRLMIRTRSEALIARQANDSGARGDVLQLVCHALRNRIAGGAEPMVLAKDGEILVHPGRVIDSWGNIYPHEKCPRAKVRAALKALAVDARERRPLNGSRARYLSISLDALRDTTEALGYDRAIVADWLAASAAPPHSAMAN